MDKISIIETKLKFNNIEYETERVISINGILRLKNESGKEYLEINDKDFKIFGFVNRKEYVSDSFFVYTSNNYCVAEHENNIITISEDKP